MKPALVVSDAQIELEARRFFVDLLEPRPDEAALAHWEAWLEADPRHRDAYARVAEAWALAGLVGASARPLGALHADTYRGHEPVAIWNARRQDRVTRWRLPAAVGIAAAIGAVAVLLGFSVLRDLAADPQEAFVTAKAQHRDIVLSDGSKVALGAATELKVRYDRARRTLTLPRGEALFEVTSQPKRPFIVSTPFSDVIAVGTAFDVTVGPHRVGISVTKGVVEIARATTGPNAVATIPLRVSAGQRFIIDARGARFVELDTAEGAPAWREGRLEYRGEELSNVIEDVNRYSTRPIVLQDAQAGQFKYTGTVLLGAADSWALGLQGAFPVTVSPSSDGRIVIRAAPRSGKQTTRAGGVRPQITS